MAQDDTANGRHVTLEDVVRVAGVSLATGSRVINGSRKVNPEARQAVERAIAQLGYVPNRAARSLMTRRSNAIGVIIPAPTSRILMDPFFLMFFNAIGTELAFHAYQLLLVMPQSFDEEEHLERYLASGHIDGVAITALHGDDPLPERIAARGVPVVVSGRAPVGARASYVDADCRGGAAAATAHLIAHGRRKLATISGSLDMPSAMDRLLGYRDALEAAGIPGDPTLEAIGDFSQEGAVEAMSLLLERHPDLDGVFVASDTMAAMALSVLQRFGRRIPDDVAVVGFDDQPIARTTAPSLTSVRHPIDLMSHEMVGLLLDNIEGGNHTPTQVVFPTELVIRESSGGPPETRA